MIISLILQTEIHEVLICKSVVHWFTPTLSVTGSNTGYAMYDMVSGKKPCKSKFICSFYLNGKSDIFGPLDDLTLTLSTRPSPD